MQNEIIAKFRKFNDSYRRYICGNNKDAESASWFRSGRAAKRKIHKKLYTVDNLLSRSRLRITRK